MLRTRSQTGDPAARAARRLALFQDLAGALSSAVTPKEVADALFSRALVNPDLIRGKYQQFEPGRAARGETAWIVLPLVVEGRRRGVLGLAFSEPIHLDDADRAFVLAVTNQCAISLERALLHEENERARLEAERQRDVAERAVEIQDQIVGIVGHDLRTPLAAISMAAALLQRKGGLQPEQLANVQRIVNSSTRMISMIRDLLDFTRVRADGKIVLERVPVDVGELAQRAVSELKLVHPGREIRFEGDARHVISGDPQRLHQAMSNLVSNALQHGASARPVRVEIGHDATTVSFSVHNEGPPIADHVLPTLFEPFRRGEGGARRGNGLGLGLFIVREIARAHGGGVDVTSTEAEGTTFTLRLPCSP